MILRALLLLCVLLTVAPAAPAQPSAASLRVATWNLEWLLTTGTTHALSQRCRGTGRARLPCDVVLGSPRSAADYAALSRYAARLDADVVALQEVEDERAARQVFGRGYDYCLSRRAGLQNVGFAIRRGLAFRCEAALEALSLGGRLRPGVALTLQPGQPGELRLLAVHLKSGCSREPLGSSRRQCRLLARQGPVLGAWIDAQVAAGRDYVVLGDFNRELRREPAGEGLGTMISDGNPLPEDLHDAGRGTAFVPCRTGQTFTGYIDYILLGRGAAARQVAGSFRRLRFSDADALRYRLSDHCPLLVELRLR